MDIAQALPLLSGLTPQQFMRRHWQKKPLVVRGAIPGFQLLWPRQELFALAAREDVESRLVFRAGRHWALRRGPFARRALPPLSRPSWTLLLQGADLHDDRARQLLNQFRFVPEARVDDLMISYATDGGGVGPHLDSYDVFLLQAQGRRRWRIGRQKDQTWLPDSPLKVLARFQPEQEFVLEPGDMLYLPPRFAHDGIAQGECQTYSIGFRSPGRGELARELLQRLADAAAQAAGERLYRDPAQQATANPGAIPPELRNFARDALAAGLRDPLALDRALGEYPTEPMPSVRFDHGHAVLAPRQLSLDRRSRMMYDSRHVFINGEGYLVSGRDARLMRALADLRRLGAAEVAGASEAARALLRSWCEAGWAHAEKEQT